MFQAEATASMKARWTWSGNGRDVSEREGRLGLRNHGDPGILVFCQAMMKDEII